MAKHKRVRQKKWMIPVAHFLCWVLFFSIPFLSRDNYKHLGPYDHPFPPFIPNKNNLLYLSLTANTSLVLIFYLNIFFIAPILTLRKKYGRYVLVQSVSLILFYLLIRFITSVILKLDSPMPIGIQLFNYVIVVMGSLCYSLIQNHINAERIQKENENETLRAELTFLRWQISPHFLFNVLNSMVALARIRSERTEEMLINLSNLMRYMLYETDARKISIERETEYLKKAPWAVWRMKP